MTTASRDATDALAMRESQITAAMHGDRAAFAALYFHRVAAVRAALKCLTATAAPPQDATTQVFERAWRELPSLSDPVRFDAWLLDIVEEVADRMSLSDGWSAVQAAAPLEARLDLLARHVRNLVPAHRRVVLLRTLFQLSGWRTARALGTTADEVYALERSALELIAESL